VWDFANRDSVGELPVHATSVSGLYNKFLAISPVDPNEIAVIQADGEVILCNINNCRKKLPINNLEVKPQSFYYANYATQLYLCSHSHLVAYDLGRRQAFIKFRLVMVVIKFELATEGLTITADMGEGGVKLFDIETGETVCRLEREDAGMMSYSKPAPVILL
jgi:hypothetical protein